METPLPPDVPPVSVVVPESSRVPATVAYFGIGVLTGLVTAAFGPSLPQLAAHTHSPISQISFLLTARALGNLLGSLQGGRLYDRVRGHRLMLIVLLSLAGALALVPVISQLWLLTLVVLMVGVTKGTLDVGGNTLMVWQHGRRAGPYISAMYFFWGVGAFLFPLLVVQSFDWIGDINWAFWIPALLILPAVLWLVRLPSPVAREVSADGVPYRVNSFLVALLAIFLFVYVGAEASFHSWIYTYVISLGLGSDSQAAYLTSAFWASFTVGRLIAIPLVARFRPRYILLADLIGCLVGIGIIVSWPASVSALWVGVGMVGLSMASIFPTALTLAEGRVTITGKVTSWLFVGASAGGMVVPWLIGQLFESVGPQVMMFTVATDIVLAGAMLVVILLFGGPVLPRREEAGLTA